MCLSDFSNRKNVLCVDLIQSLNYFALQSNCAVFLFRWLYHVPGELFLGMLTRSAIPGTACLAAVLGVGSWRPGHFQTLEYDELHHFGVGKYRITIQTRSFSISSGDDGAAELVVECPSAQR